MKCFCGSGKFIHNCHKENGTKKRIRHYVRNEIFYKDNKEVTLYHNIEPQGFGKRQFKGQLRYWLVHTPAGPLIYPLFIIWKNKAVRPFTIDGLYFYNEHNKTFQFINCMITPFSRGVIKFITQKAQILDNNYFNVPCHVECEGNPFCSAWSLEYKEEKIKLYHHTTRRNKELIISSNKLIGSKWNLQGTRKLSVYNYIYFTDLEEIKSAFDLIEIGMTERGTSVKLCTDNGVIKEIPVYRDSKENRKAVLKCWVPIELIAPQPIILHVPTKDNKYSWWEIFMPAIFRVPVKPETYLPIKCIQKDEYLLERNDNFISIGGFNAALGIDMESMERILSEYEDLKLIRDDEQNLRPADLGYLDPQWKEIWQKMNLSAIAAEILQAKMS